VIGSTEKSEDVMVWSSQDTILIISEDEDRVSAEGTGLKIVSNVCFLRELRLRNYVW